MAKKTTPKTQPDQPEAQALPRPTELRAYRIPGYLMPIIAEWLQLGLSSTYAFLTTGKTPSAPTITRLSKAPYNIHPTVWKKPAAHRAELVYATWYELQEAREALRAQQEDEENQLLTDILQ